MLNWAFFYPGLRKAGYLSLILSSGETLEVGLLRAYKQVNSDDHILLGSSSINVIVFANLYQST